MQANIDVTILKALCGALPLIAYVPRIAQPEPDHQTLLARLRIILEGRAPVAGLEVIDVLNLATLHDVRNTANPWLDRLKQLLQ